MNRVFACSDLHGHYKVFKSILQKIDETDRVIVLGDVVDRGEDGFRILKEILSDERFILLKGNHEDMFYDDIKEFHQSESRDECHVWNGGDPTFWAWRQDGENFGWLHALNSLPDHFYYINKDKKELILTHAGYTPPLNPLDDDILWNRSHVHDDYDGFEEYIIHGHTPIPHILSAHSNKAWKILAEEGPLWYCGGHKCCLDCGTWFTGVTFLLDLDTFEAIRCGEEEIDG